MRYGESIGSSLTGIQCQRQLHDGQGVALGAKGRKVPAGGHGVDDVLAGGGAGGGDAAGAVDGAGFVGDYDGEVVGAA